VLNFKKFAILMAYGVKRINKHNHTIFHSDWSNHYRDIAILGFSRWRPSAMLDFKTFEILTADRVKRVNLPHFTKFYVDQSNHCRDVAVFRFLQTGSRPPSWICCVRVWTIHRAFGSVYHCVKFGLN